MRECVSTEERYVSSRVTRMKFLKSLVSNGVIVLLRVATGDRGIELRYLRLWPSYCMSKECTQLVISVLEAR